MLTPAGGELVAVRVGCGWPGPLSCRAAVHSSNTQKFSDILACKRTQTIAIAQVIFNEKWQISFYKIMTRCQ